MTLKGLHMRTRKKVSRGPIGHPPCCAWATIRNGREKHGLGQEKRSGGLHEGDAARVFSRSPDEWVDRQVVAFAEGNFICMEHDMGEDWCRKTVHLHSEHPVLQTMGDPSSRSLPNVRFSTSSLTSSVVEFDPGANCTNDAKASDTWRKQVSVQLGNQGAR